MASARRLYRAGVALAAAGVGAVALAVAVAATAFSLSVPSLGELAAACRRFLPAETGLSALVLITAGGLGLVVLVRAARSLGRQLAAQRRGARGRRIHGRAELGGAEYLIVRSASAQAFCAGLLRPRVYVSSAALERLSDAELAAVLAHERHHLRRRDPLRMLFANVLADALFFLPALRRLADRYGALAEVAADEAAVQATGRGTLASALLAFGERATPEVAVGIAPERVDHLLGRRPRWELSATAAVGSLSALAALVGASLGAIRVADGDLNLPVALAESCMALMALAAVGLSVGALALVGRTAVRR